MKRTMRLSLIIVCPFLFQHTYSMEKSLSSDSQTVDQFAQSPEEPLVEKFSQLSLKVVSNPMQSMWQNCQEVAGIRERILYICVQLAQFHEYMFKPSAELFYQKFDRKEPQSLVDLFFGLFTQLSIIMNIECHCHVSAEGLFKNDDWNWHATIDFRENSLEEFAGSHKPQALLQQALVHTISMRFFLKMMQRETKNVQLSIAIMRAIFYIDLIKNALSVVQSNDFAGDLSVLRSLQQIKPELKPRKGI